MVIILISFSGKLMQKQLNSSNLAYFVLLGINDSDGL